MNVLKMPHLVFGIALGATGVLTYAEAPTVIDFNETHWQFVGSYEVENFDGRQTLVLGETTPAQTVSFGAAFLKNTRMGTGTIEYDVMLNENTANFAGIRFHVQPDGSYEDFYQRSHRSGDPDASQYMAVYNDVPSWQLYQGPAFSTATVFDFGTWTSVKLVVDDTLADVFIGDMDKPALTFELEHGDTMGGIGLWAFNLAGTPRFSNVRVTPNNDVKILGQPKRVSTLSPGTFMDWKVSTAFDGKKLDGITNLADLKHTALDSSERTSITADKNGRLNLARVQGLALEKDTVLAEITIDVEEATTREVEFGFSDDVRVYVNGELVFSGSDRFGSRDYRFLGTIGYYDTVVARLKKGSNSIQFAVTENIQDPTGWAVQARLK